ncbi:MAG: molybdenum cofactor guanylyltransferase [Candidatus Caldatribacteriota bacterium]|jgi:molybdopterin-guanine dinucleotide biosynthesis protein A|nr:molybdenum cofactor guanylyltransferase [Atribacterota bacterium]MDD3031366.1 molybdenum cofactor guanylyltransferase [Atribacterota bacterium]MDD3640851.1 molybdenum cofactor guanylyltransferase [Atribacterota bacterium]MDD4288366.1 molybdenum cofactor guanylyltransferase [Atribacterota bacterium]MDD4764687.1 molybdenum cofactor guanylyltransferase [Atribacterota bacterium]
MDKEKFTPITIIILAGGKSSRIGLNKDKGKMKLLGVNLIDRVVSNILSSGLFSEKDLLLVGPKKRFPDYNRVVEDIYPQKGPLGGIFSGLHYSKTFYSLIIGYDMPFIKSNLIHYMAENIDNHDAVIPTHSQGLLEPLCAIYSKNCLKVMENNIKNNELSVRRIFPFLKIRLINEREIKRFDPKLHSFFNINYKSDFNRAEELSRKRRRE